MLTFSIKQNIPKKLLRMLEYLCFYNAYAYMTHKRTTLCSVQHSEFEVLDDEVWGCQATDSSIPLCLCIIKDSQSPESRHSQTKGPLWHGTRCLQPPETAPLLSGWQLVTLAIVLQPGHPSSIAPCCGSGGVGPTGRTHGGRREHSVTLDDIYQPVIGISWTCNTSGNVGCFCSTPQLPSINLINLYLALALGSLVR